MAYVAGNGGTAGNAGTVTIDNKCRAQRDRTAPQPSASVAQSAGGQGGPGGSSDNGTVPRAAAACREGRATRSQITNTAAITTAGGMAVAAQSIGGFGGDAGTNTKGYGGAGGFGGNGGSVTIINTGQLTVGKAGLPDCSRYRNRPGCNPVGMYGLAAQSVGGGGGNAGAAAGLHALGASGGTAGYGARSRSPISKSIAVFGASSIGVLRAVDRRRRRQRRHGDFVSGAHQPPRSAAAAAVAAAAARLQVTTAAISAPAMAASPA